MGLKLEVGKKYRSTKGEKIGPMIQHMTTTFIIKKGDGCVWNDDGSCFNQTTDAIYGDLIAEWPADDAPTGPVRTVTRKEIVPGMYGDVEVVEDDTYQGGIGIYINATMDAARIRAAANSMLAVADALEEQ